MPLNKSSLPFGLRDVRLTPYTAAGALDTSNAVDLPAARVFSFKETEDFESLTGDDTTVASLGKGPIAEWSLEGGGISLLVWKTLAGGTITSLGTTPAQSNSYSKLTTQARPYFQVEGQAISDSGGDLHTIVYRCKADGDLEASNGGGSFMLTAASGKGYGDLTTKKLYDFVQNETAVIIAAAVLV